MRDSCTAIQVKRVISPTAAVTDNTPFVGQIIDHQGYDAATYLMQIGANTDINATFAVLLEESDAANMDGANAVADEDMVSQTRGTAPETAAAFTAANDDNEVRKIGYLGIKRYTRLTVTPSANDSGNVFLAAMCVLSQRAPGNAVAAQAAS